MLQRDAYGSPRLGNSLRDWPRRDNTEVSVDENTLVPRIITNSTWRRIRMGIARIIRAEFPINPRCYIRERRRSRWCYLGSPRKPRGYQMVMRFSAGKRAMFSA